MRYLLPIALILLLFPVSGQTLYTFSNTTTVTINSASTTQRTITVSGVPTSGMVLRQVNISFGNGTSLYSGDMSGFTLKLKDPSNNEINLLTPGGSFTTSGSSNADNKYFNIRLRDHAGLKTPKDQAAATGSTLSKGYPFYHGYYKPEGSFSSFNTTSAVNGTWTFSVAGYSTSYARTFTKVELIFGPAIGVTDIRATPPNQTCATKTCLQTGSVFWAKNNGAGTNQASAPGNTVGTCTWNGSKDNMIWFYFVASQSTAEVSLSGFSTVQESIVVKAPACGSYTLATAGCYDNMFSGSASTTKYFGGSWASGYAWNHGYYLTGLVSGNMYMLVIDGSSASNSEYYIELLNGASNGCSPLPIELLDFSAEPFGNQVNLSWVTATERDNDYFTISRSADMVTWEDIAEIPGSGNTNFRRDYAFTDIDPLPGTSYYQLRQTDYNGQFEVFAPISIILDQKDRQAMLVQPNPARNDFYLRIRGKGYEQACVEVRDISGKSVLLRNVSLHPDTDKLEIADAQLHQGIYVVSVFLPDGGSCSAKLVIE